jgi:16S rRNA (guanine(527)-N(7))-methyltransferase RsmG
VWLADIVRQHLAGLVELSESQSARLNAHYDLLLQWNSRMNLTTVTELHEAAVRHYCESIFLALHVTGGSMVDVGSGAGFPGIPVAIMLAGSEVHLVESHQRKAVFLREATRDLANVKVHAARAETLKGSFDWLISRAVAAKSLVPLKLARSLAVLCGEDDAGVLRPDRVIPLPWGEKRVLVIRST